MGMYTHDEMMHMVFQKVELPDKTGVAILVRDVRKLSLCPDLLMPMVALNSQAEHLVMAAPLFYAHNSKLVEALQSVVEIVETCQQIVKQGTGQESEPLKCIIDLLSGMENTCMMVQRMALQGCEVVNKELAFDRRKALDGQKE